MAAGAEAQVSWPTHRVPNTESIWVIRVPKTVVQRTIGHLLAAAPNEAPLCLYGEILSTGRVMDGVGIDSLDINEILPADPASYTAYPDSVVFGELTDNGCRRTPRYLGAGHTHLGLVPNESCLPSVTDLWTFILDRKAVVMAIFCDNGLGFLQLRDGRHWQARWA